MRIRHFEGDIHGYSNSDGDKWVVFSQVGQFELTKKRVGSLKEAVEKFREWEKLRKKVVV